MKARGWMTAAAMVVAVMAATGAYAGEKKAPEFGTWQYWQAIEAGTLTPSDGAMKANPGVVGKQELPTIELGGVVFRIGLDTN